MYNKENKTTLSENIRGKILLLIKAIESSQVKTKGTASTAG